MNFEEIWEYREEKIYPKIFGAMSAGIYTLQAELFHNVFEQAEVDPRWLCFGVMVSEPNEKRNSWIYVSSGLSNPWDDTEEDFANNEESGLGVEFVIETAKEEKWAIAVLQKMIAYNLLIGIGKFGDQALIDYSHRIPLNGPVSGKDDDPLRFLIVAEPDHYQKTFRLESGGVRLLHFIGVTEAEREFARENSTVALVERLKTAGVYPRTDPTRSSII